MFRAALALAKPGDVIVVDGKADLTCSLTRFLMVSQAKAAGLAGFVVDAECATPRKSSKAAFPCSRRRHQFERNDNGLGERVNWPVSVGGAMVSPGDLVIGDSDGVVVSRVCAFSTKQHAEHSRTRAIES